MADIPRLERHFEPEKGWMNDPNGLCWFGGKHHAFFQHNPHAAVWGPMHWGHAVTEDLIHWQELPIALYPDMPYEDFGGCFSGSAIEKDGVLYLFYTAVSKKFGQAQAIAFSKDGTHFEKYGENPILRSPVDPESRDFRDPKVFACGGGYRMVCGAGTDGLGRVLLFRSDDLLHWDYAGPIFESRDYGAVPECPDLFPLGDKWVLMFSRMDETRSAQFIVGDFDGTHFTAESFQQPEKGTDFYAPQTYVDGRGRRLMIGWLYNWTRKVPEDAVRTGALTLARELSLRDGKVICAPVEEAAPLLTDTDGCILREGGRVKITNGAGILLDLPEEEAGEVKVFADTRTREVFLGGGEYTCTFYLEN